jgi:hypothetical protein
MHGGAAAVWCSSCIGDGAVAEKQIDESPKQGRDTRRLIRSHGDFRAGRGGEMTRFLSGNLVPRHRYACYSGEEALVMIWPQQSPQPTRVRICASRDS